MDEWTGDFDGGSRECVSRVRVGCGGCRGSRGQGGGGKMKIWVRIVTLDDHHRDDLLVCVSLTLGNLSCHGACSVLPLGLLIGVFASQAADLEACPACIIDKLILFLYIYFLYFLQMS